MKRPFLSSLLGLFIMALSSNLLISSAVSELNCAMCGKPINVKLKTGVTVNDGTSYYCCPHCAIMSLTATPGKVMGAKVTLTDYKTGRGLSAEDGFVVLDAGNVFCCAPAILAFREREDAEVYGKGRIMTWKEVFQELRKIRCGFCGMAVYPPDAYWVKAGNAHGGDNVYGCCILCAIGIAWMKESRITMDGLCRECGGKIRITSGENGKSFKARPETVIIWQGLKESQGKMVPAGCHFNLLFCTEKCVKQYTAVHPELKHREMKLAEAFENVAKAAAAKMAP